MDFVFFRFAPYDFTANEKVHFLGTNKHSLFLVISLQCRNTSCSEGGI